MLIGAAVLNPVSCPRPTDLVPCSGEGDPPPPPGDGRAHDECARHNKAVAGVDEVATVDEEMHYLVLSIEIGSRGIPQE